MRSSVILALFAFATSLQTALIPGPDVVNGDDAGGWPRLRFVDATGQTFQASGEKITWKRWRYITIRRLLHLHRVDYLNPSHFSPAFSWGPGAGGGERNRTGGRF